MKSIQRLRLTIARFATRGYINLRSSMVDLTDLPPGSRSVALMGIGLLLAMAIVATMLYILHKAGTLSNEVAPLTFFLASLALGWSYALTGALHARRVVGCARKGYCWFIHRRTAINSPGPEPRIGSAELWP